jgi:hypothetical protein
MNNTIATPAPSATISSRLSPEQLDAYHREGYIVYDKNVLQPAKFQKLKAYFESLLAALPEGERPEAMDMPHLIHPELFKWLFDDEILDLVEPIVGRDIALFATGFICKPKGDGRRVPWHEDSAYWKTMLVPMEVATIWLAIDPSTTENGCMYVIPRTHEGPKKGFSDYDPVDITKNVFPTEIVENQRDASKAVPCILQPNRASLHDARLMHGSAPNTSNIRRCGYTMRFMSTKCRLTDEARAWHKIYLARGRDLAGQEYADPSKTYPELIALRAKIGKKGH